MSPPQCGSSRVLLLLSLFSYDRYFLNPFLVPAQGYFLLWLFFIIVSSVDGVDTPFAFAFQFECGNNRTRQFRLRQPNR